ncbi:sugar phosphate isomerase/epimerase family protein [Mucilaginibacter ginkgonis]|uniref:Sugar phosphate isomerase/epimerase n=1 Tax=Mucilaginibacter ginkgonis TaxID=2682091 RepID=A0A6I4IMP2_9SPHI|nr:sugar phosphate isomerase/epimerase [Mucilaginibacter ginkgonis]QQL50308.1 sugar phosphate isomerase/epimerase [Mucilaginibacter ginkgonis]
MDRRSFINSSGLLALSLPAAKLLDRVPARIKNYGIQLYMVRDEMEKDAPGTLAKLGKMGYTEIESYGGNKGIFWGMPNTDFKKLAADNGLTLISSHYNDSDMAFEKQVALAAQIGMKYLICPWKGPQKSIDDFKRIADEFNIKGEICKKHGLRYGYHPHDYPYKKIDGQLPIDVLLENTDKDLVYYQMDFYYTVTEGQNPQHYLTKYKDRFTLCHMRDVLKHRLLAGSKDESACDLGQGIINYPHLLNIARKNGMAHFFVEQSRYFHETPLQSAAINARYMKNLRLV